MRDSLSMIKPMVMRTMVAVLMLLAIADAYPYHRWYDQPLVLDDGLHVTDTLTHGVRGLRYHARISAKPGAGSWGIVWNMTDSLNYMSAMLAIPAGTNDIYGHIAELSVISVCDGVSSEICSKRLTDVVDADGRFNSLKLVYDGYDCRLFVGHEYQHEVCEVPFDTSAPGMLGVRVCGQAACQRLSSSADILPAAVESPFDSLDLLYGYLGASNDAAEGVWEYMDRNISGRTVTLGGKYVIATVRNGDAYDIVYIDGAQVSAASWPQLSIKGVMTPTIFRGNYDMRWTCADGTVVDDDVNAQLSDDGAVLTLRFPTLRAELRFRRVLMH